MRKDIIREGICFKDTSSYERKLARTITIIRENSRCGICGKLDEEVYHKIKLTPNNVTNLEVSVNQNNLMLLFKECPNREHVRFTNKSGVGFDNEGNFIIK